MKTEIVVKEIADFSAAIEERITRDWDGYVIVRNKQVVSVFDIFAAMHANNTCTFRLASVGCGLDIEPRIVRCTMEKKTAYNRETGTANVYIFGYEETKKV